MKVGEVGMTETDKLLARIGTARDAISRKTEQTSLDYMIDGVLMNCSVMLKEQNNEKKRIMKVIWDTLHEGLSIDTVADQDWVYERIRHRIEDT